MPSAVGDFSDQEPAAVLRFDISLDGLTAATNLTDTSQIREERLRALVQNARRTLLAFQASILAATAAEASERQAQAERREREHDRQVEDRFGRL